MGHLDAPGVYNTPDPDEYVRISGDLLRERNGRYELARNERARGSGVRGSSATRFGGASGRALKFIQMKDLRSRRSRSRSTPRATLARLWRQLTSTVTTFFRASRVWTASIQTISSFIRFAAMRTIMN